jgi:RNA polymerase sigma-70 factor, ECF subfamily
VDYVRTLPRHTAQPLDVVADIPEHQTGSEYRSVLDRQTLEPALARLTAEQRQAVELRFLQGMSVAETSAAMKRSEEAVKKLQARALANLRRALTEQTRQAAPVRLVRVAA